MKHNTLQKVFSRNKNVVFAAVFCVLLWGSAYPGVKIGYQLFGLEQANVGSKLLFAGYRFSIAGMMILVFGSMLEGRLLLPKKRDWNGILVLGLVQTVIQYFFYYIGLSNTTGAKGAIVYASSTFIAVILPHFYFENDKMNRFKAVGCILGFVGILTVNLGNDLSSPMTLNGEGLLFLGAIASAVAMLMSKVISKKQNPMTLTSYQMLLGGITLVICGYSMNGQVTVPSMAAIGMLLYLAAVSAVAFGLWSLLLKYNPVSKVSIYTALLPVFGALLSGIFLGDDIWNVQMVLAMSLVAVGIWVMNRKR